MRTYQISAERKDGQVFTDITSVILCPLQQLLVLKREWSTDDSWKLMRSVIWIFSLSINSIASTCSCIAKIFQHLILLKRLSEVRLGRQNFSIRGSVLVDRLFLRKLVRRFYCFRSVQNKAQLSPIVAKEIAPCYVVQLKYISGFKVFPKAE